MPERITDSGIDQKRKLQKCKEILMPIAITATTRNVSLRVIVECGENKKFS